MGLIVKSLDLSSFFFFFGIVNITQGLVLLDVWTHGRRTYLLWWAVGFIFSSSGHFLSGLMSTYVSGEGGAGFSLIVLSMCFFYSGVCDLLGERQRLWPYIVFAIDTVSIFTIEQDSIHSIFVYFASLSIVQMSIIGQILAKFRGNSNKLLRRGYRRMISSFSLLFGVSFAQTAISALQGFAGWNGFWDMRTTLVLVILIASIGYSLLYGTLLGVHAGVLENELVVYTNSLEMSSQKLLTLSETDELTGLANRRKFNETLKKRWRVFRRVSRPFGLLMIDVDYFKIYNDRYGHPQGDACLKNVAGAIQALRLRSGALAARYGGEEFAVILPEVDPGGLHGVAQRILDAVINMDIRHEGTPLSKKCITVSIGGAISKGQDDMMSLLRRADQALYQAKRSGRCRYLFQESEEVEHDTNTDDENCCRRS